VKIGIQTWGSHGDVAPFIALAAGLTAAGHDVRLAVTTDGSVDYADRATAGGFEMEMVHSEFETPPFEGLRNIVHTPNPVKQVALLNESFFDPAVEEMYDAAQRLCTFGDIVIGHFWLHPLLTAAELSRTPRVTLHMCPIGVRSRYFPAFGPDFGPLINGWLWNLGDRLVTRAVFDSANAIRIREGLEPVRSLQRQLFISGDMTLIAASPVLCKRPPDWGAQVHLTGPFGTDPAARRGEFAPALRDFVAAGEPPVFVTFGSCDVLYGDSNVPLLIEAVERSGRRAIVQTQSDALPDDYDRSRIKFVREADHSAVFPLCSLVIHHGGAGTTHTALAAGVPTIIVEHGFDQMYWANASVREGISPALLHRRSVTPKKLARAIDDALASDKYTERARALAARTTSSEGVEQAVRLIGERFG